MEKQETHLFLRSQFREKPFKGEKGQCGGPKQVLTSMEDVLAQHAYWVLGFSSHRRGFGVSGSQRGDSFCLSPFFVHPQRCRVFVTPWMPKFQCWGFFFMEKLATSSTSETVSLQTSHGLARCSQPFRNEVQLTGLLVSGTSVGFLPRLLSLARLCSFLTSIGFSLLLIPPHTLSLLSLCKFWEVTSLRQGGLSHS